MLACRCCTRQRWMQCKPLIATSVWRSRNFWNFEVKGWNVISIPSYTSGGYLIHCGWTVGPCLTALAFPFRQVCRVNAQRLGMGSALFTRFGAAKKLWLFTRLRFDHRDIIISMIGGSFQVVFATNIKHLDHEMLWFVAVGGHQSSRTPADLTAIRWKMAKS